jgi:hypothetical protein
VRARTEAIASSADGAWARRRTKAEPTITPSAKEATSAAWPRVLTPRPTATGKSVCSRIRATVPPATELTASLVPVMPIRLTA